MWPNSNDSLLSSLGSYGGGFNAPNIGGVSSFAAPAAPSGNWLQNSGFLGSYNPTSGIKTDGWGGLALGAAQGLGNAFLGMKQYGLAKDTFNENKRQFALNYDAQKRTTNAALSDRQSARVASNPGAYQSVGEYMKQYGIQ